MNDDIETLRKSLSLVTMAEKAGADLRFQYGEYRSACPLHGGENKSAFVIYEKQGRMRWKCFTGDCNERGGGNDEFAFMIAMTGRTFAEVLQDLRGGKIPQVDPQAEQERRLKELERKIADLEKRTTDLEKWRETKPWERYHENLDDKARQQWEARGVPECFQNFWHVGKCDDFHYRTDENWYTSPTLTFPIYQPGWDVATARHRILEPHDPSDKYRPDCPGLGSHAFLGDPDLGYDLADKTIVVEGEIKGMVTFSTYDKPMTQVIGIPGKSIWHDVADKIKGQDVYICLDPDATKEACTMARDLGGAKVIVLSEKIDDAIINYGLDGQWINSLLTSARYIK